jgi:hypothetical protein
MICFTNPQKKKSRGARSGERGGVKPHNDFLVHKTNKQKNKLHGLSPRTNYTDLATATGRRR